jgi:catechol 2,3-dioxygenase-like lactoylglutathione lyase family enzyme
MLNHVSIGVRDIARSRAFYDETLAVIRFKRLSTGEDSLGYGDDSVVFWI